MTDKKRIFATSRIGDPAENRLRDRGYELEVFEGPEAPPKKLIIEKVKSGIDALITTLRDPIDAEIFEAGKGTLKIVAQIAVGFDNINRADADKYKVPFTNTADVLTEATAEFAFLMLGMLARKMYASERLVREQKWPSWHPFLPFLGDEVTGKTIAVIGTGRIGLAMIKKDVCKRAPGAGTEVAIVASVPAVPGRRSYGQDHRRDRDRADRAGDDQERCMQASAWCGNRSGHRGIRSCRSWATKLRARPSP